MVQNKTVIVAILLTFLFGCSTTIDTTKKFDVYEAIKHCQVSLPYSSYTPSDNGGFSVIKSADEAIVCLSGTLEDLHLEELVDALTDMRVTTVVARSAGGPVSIWFRVAEALKHSRPLLVVDQICGSSCSIFLTPIASQIYVRENSLLVWHGGPSALPFAIKKENIKTVSQFEQLIQNLYREALIDPKILETSVEPYTGSIDFIHAERIFKNELFIDGYAFSNGKLATCYNFRVHPDSWHPGGNKEVYETAIRLSANLIILESPNNSC